MNAVSDTAARENLDTVIDRVCSERDPVIITRNRGQAVVVMALDDYESVQETAYLLRYPANIKRLLASIDSLYSDKGFKKARQRRHEAVI